MLGLREQSVPEMKGKIFVNTTQNAYKMGLEGLNCFFRQVSSMVMWWDKLVGHVVIFDCGLEVCRTLVVQYVSFGCDTRPPESINEDLLHSYHFARCAVFHCFVEDSVAVNVR